MDQIMKVAFILINLQVIAFRCSSIFADASIDVDVQLQEEFFSWSTKFRRSYASSEEYNNRMEIWLHHNGTYVGSDVIPL
jgi:hypothetical protein